MEWIAGTAMVTRNMKFSEASCSSQLHLKLSWEKTSAIYSMQSHRDQRGLVTSAQHTHTTRPRWKKEQKSNDTSTPRSSSQS